MLKEGIFLNFEEFEDDVLEERKKIYSIVPKTSKIVYCDTSKGYEDIEVVIKRNSDSKYFKITYSQAESLSINSDGLCNFPMDGIEVFPKEKTVTIYE